MSAPSFLNGKSSPPPQRPTKGNKLGRAKKPNNKNPKKPRQRGLGVFELERLRLQETQKMTEFKSVYQTQYLPISPAKTVPEMVPVGGYPVQWNYALGRPTISGGFWLGQGLVDPYGSGAPERMRFDDDHPHVLESSKELPPIPNLAQSQSQSLLLDCCCNNSSCYKKKGTNQENNGDKFNPDSNFSMSDSEFLGLSLGNNINGRIKGVEAPHKLNEGLELVTVHRRAKGIMGGSVVLEYDFLPGNTDRSTPSKELPGFPIEDASASSSVLDGGSETSYNAAFTTGASNSVDLSLKLSF